MGANKPKADTAASNGHREGVLVVAEMPLLADVVRLMLEAAGFSAAVAPATTTESVVDEAVEGKRAVVLLDSRPPDCGDVVELVSRLTQAGCRVLMFMAPGDEVIVANCVDAGAVGYVRKDGSGEDLIERVARALIGSQVLTLEQRYRLEDARRASKDHAAELARFEALSTREKDVLVGLTRGYSAAMIAEDHFVALSTVRTQIRSILAKLDVNSQLGAVALVRETGWTHEPSPDADYSRQAGATMVEYALMVGLIALVVAVAVGVFGVGVGALFENAGDCVGDIASC